MTVCLSTPIYLQGFGQTHGAITTSREVMMSSEVEQLLDAWTGWVSRESGSNPGHCIAGYGVTLFESNLRTAYKTLR
jgi:hypothetical protein